MSPTTYGTHRRRRSAGSGRALRPSFSGKTTCDSMIQSSCGGSASSLFGAQASNKVARPNKRGVRARFMGGDSTAPILFGEDGAYFWDVVNRHPQRSQPMVLVILLVLALFFIQTLLPGRFREAPAPGGQNELAENLGNRD